MAKVDVLLGLQWGDEGKGKVIDVLTPNYDVITRFQGGPNAGHTLEFNGEKYVLRSIPSGIFQGDKVNVISNGVVLDPALFKAEAEALLVVIPDYYITGTIAGGWNGNEVKMTYSGDIWSHTFSASALTAGTEYKLKVTEGNWDGGKWGTINGTIPGVSNDGDGNVCFKLSTVGDVTVTFDAVGGCLE